MTEMTDGTGVTGVGWGTSGFFLRRGVAGAKVKKGVVILRRGYDGGVLWRHESNVNPG